MFKINFVAVTPIFYIAPFMLNIRLIHLKSFTTYDSTIEQQKQKRKSLPSENKWAQ